MSLWLKIKEIISKMLPKKTVEEVLHVTPCVSDRMADAIELWSDMYEDKAPWLCEPTELDSTRVVSLGLPAMIASEKARMVTLEMKTEISAPMQQVTKTSNPNASSVVTQDESSTQYNEQNGSTGNKSQVQPSLEAGKQDTAASASAIPSSITPSSAYQQTVEEVPAGPTERADFLNSQYKKLIRQIRRQLEYGVAKGGLVIKPYIVIYDKDKLSNSNSNESTVKTQENTFSTSASYNDSERLDSKEIAQKNAKSKSGRLSYDSHLLGAEIEFDFIQADRFFPLAFDANGKVVEAAFIQTKLDKALECVFIRLEYHKLVGRTVTVENYAFKSKNTNIANHNNIRSVSNLGEAIPLTTVPEWATLQPKTVIEDVDRLLFAYFRMPEANTVDPYSPLGVSGFSRVVQLIRDADEQYSRMLWEFEGGELAIDVDRDALKFVTDPNGEARTVLPQKQQRLFRKVDLNAEDTYNVFSPPLRDVSIIHGLNTILMRIEDATGLSRGTLSEVTSQDAKTATELKILKQRSYATNADIQAALQFALEDVVYVMDVYATLYEVTPQGNYEISFEWDDSIIMDSESELSKRITLMQNGLASKLETRMWYFGETENQAKAALQQIEEEATQAVMQNVQAEVMKSTAFGTNNAQNEEDGETSPAGDTTSAKKGTGKQADRLKNPTKAKDNKAVKTEE